MVTNKFTNYLTLSNELTANIDLEELVQKCIKSSSKGWVLRSNNTVKTFRDEKRMEKINNVSGKKEVYYYTLKNDFDDVLFSKLFVEFIPAIKKLKYKYNGLISNEDFLECMEDSLLYALRAYEKGKCKFSTFYINLMKQRIKRIAMKSYLTSTNETSLSDVALDRATSKSNDSTSLDEEKIEMTAEIADDRSEDMVYSNAFMHDLKERYKKANDLFSWLIVDWHEDEPEFSKNKEVLKAIEHTKKDVNESAIRKIYVALRDNDAFTRSLGFITRNDLHTIRQFRTEYNNAMNRLRKDLGKEVAYETNF